MEEKADNDNWQTHVHLTIRNVVYAAIILLVRTGHPHTLLPSRNFLYRKRRAHQPIMQPRAFCMALVQLGGIGSDKTKNLAHARDMIRRAATSNRTKPDLIVLPASTFRPALSRYSEQYSHAQPLGMLQFTIRRCTFPAIRRGHRMEFQTSLR